MDTECGKSNDTILIKKSHKELTSLIQERIKNFGLEQKVTTPSNCKHANKSRQKSNMPHLSCTRSSRQNSKRNENPIEANSYNDKTVVENQSINNENLNLVSSGQKVKEIEEEKKEKIILKLNLKNFNLNADALNSSSISSNKRKNSFSGDEKLYENKLKIDSSQTNKYFRNELDTDINSINYNEDNDEDSIAAAASAMMELSSSAF